MKISIVTPSFNQARFLRECINSVLRQQCAAVEHLVMDGGSTDGTRQVLDEYADRLGGFVSEKDRGQTDALNKGLRRATGDLIGWQNSDDYYLPGSFESVVRAAESFPEDDVFFSNVFHVDEQGVPVLRTCFTDFSFQDLLYEGMLLLNQATFFRRRVLDRIGYPDESLQFSMDYEFFLRMAHAGIRFRFVKGTWGAFRQHEASKSSTIRSVGHREFWDVRYKYGHTASNWLTKVHRSTAIAKRSVRLVRQGDAGYVLRGFRKKFLGGPDAGACSANASV
jgi:glycosyltransferase involved in cell wall biosynthesis